MKTDKPTKDQVLDALIVLLDSDAIGLRPTLDLAFDSGLHTGIAIGRDREKKDAQQRIGMEQSVLLQRSGGGGGGPRVV